MLTAQDLLKNASPLHLAILLVLQAALHAGGILAGIHLAVSRIRVPWAERVTILRARAWPWEDVAILLGVLLALQGSLRLAVLGWNPDPARHELALFALGGASFHGAGLVLIAILLARRRIPWADAWGLRAADAPRDVARGALFYLATLPILTFFTIVFQAVLVRQGHPLPVQNVVVFLTRGHPWAVQVCLVLFAVVFVPWVEELLFRGIALPLLLRHVGPGPAVLLSSLAFAAIHGHLPSFVPLLVLSVAFSLGYLSSGSLLVPITMHALLNTVNLLSGLLLRN